MSVSVARGGTVDVRGLAGGPFAVEKGGGGVGGALQRSERCCRE